jgi:hypothetical protein
LGGVGLDREDGGEHGALGIGELGAEGWGVDGLLALIGRHLAEVENGANDDSPARHGNRVQLLHGIAVLLTLGQREALQGLVAFERPAALLRVHVVEPGQFVELVLLELPGKLAKSGIVLQGALLFGEREIAVVVHPLLHVLLVLGGPGDNIGFGTGSGSHLLGGGSGRVGALSPGGRRGRRRTQGAGKRRRGGNEQSECRAKTEPGWKMRFHDVDGAPDRTATMSRRATSNGQCSTGEGLPDGQLFHHTRTRLVPLLYLKSTVQGEFAKYFLNLRLLVSTYKPLSRT